MNLSYHILAVAKNNNLPITNRQLQIVLFLIFGRSLQYQSDLIEYDLPFEKWEYGATVPVIYYKFKKFGYNPILIEENIEENSYLRFLNKDIITLLKKDKYHLIIFSHKLPSWNKQADIILSGQRVANYTLKEIQQEFVQNNL